MAKTRKFVAYRRLERPYTRISKYRKLNYTRGNPHIKIAQFEGGNKTDKFPKALSLISMGDWQVRHLALESARQACNRRLERTIGKEKFHMKFRIYPHHVLRENPLASGAGADRMSTGMKKSFGKPIGKAAQVRKGKPLMTVEVDEINMRKAKEALKQAGQKFPGTCKVVEDKPLR